MGSDIKKAFGSRGRLSPHAAFTGGLTEDEHKGHIKKSLKKSEEPFRRGTSSKLRDAKKQGLLQLQRERGRVAEAEDEIAQRRGLASSKRVVRQSLIRSGGRSQTLGGT